MKSRSLSKHPIILAYLIQSDYLYCSLFLFHYYIHFNPLCLANLPIIFNQYLCFYNLPIQSKYILNLFKLTHFKENSTIMSPINHTLNDNMLFGSQQHHLDPIQINLNQYNQNSNTNRSLSGFTFFNQNSCKCPPLSDKQDHLFNSKLQDNPEISLSVGFNKHLENFFENSSRRPIQEDYKNANIKKAPTFQCSQGFLNLSSQSTRIKQENAQIDHIHQKKSIKNKNKQIPIKSGIFTNQDSIKNPLQQEMKHQNYHQSHQQKENHLCGTLEKGLYNQIQGQNNLQNLKAIAKVAFQGIKREKLATYQSISNLLLSEMSKQQQTQEDHYDSNKVECSEIKDRKSRIIESMIRSKSFKGIELMAEIQEQDQLSYESGSRRGLRLQQVDSNGRQRSGLEIQDSIGKTKSLKNIRRRLYDAINVMLAAKIIEKRQKGFLALRSNNSSSTRALKKSNAINQNSKGSSLETKQESYSMQQLQKRVYEKGRQVEAKRRYKQLLVTKYLTLQKHVNRNRQLQRKNSHSNEKKLFFPLIFASPQLPTKINLLEMGNRVQIESPQQFQMTCDLDVLGLLYWIEKEQIISKTVLTIDKPTKQANLKRLSSAKNDSQNQQSQQQQVLRKRIKIDRNNA